MSAFIVTFAVILTVIAVMAIGVIFGRRPIAGSCGGLARLGLECDCDKPCPKKLARLQAEKTRIESQTPATPEKAEPRPVQAPTDE